MSEDNNGQTRPMIEDVINDTLSGGSLTNALDFAAFLRANDMTAVGEHGEVSYKDKCLCYMHIDGTAQKPGPWTIWTEGDYSGEHSDAQTDEHTKTIAWANVNFCASCGGDCSPGTRKTIFGRDFDNVCGAAMAFTDPGAEALECVKELMMMRKSFIDKENAQTVIQKNT